MSIRLRYCKSCERHINGICEETGKITDGSEDNSGGCVTPAQGHKKCFGKNNCWTNVRTQCKESILCATTQEKLTELRKCSVLEGKKP